MKNNKIYILTAVHNELEDTKRLLRSIYSQTYKNYDVCLIDDGSTDGTSDFLQKNYPLVDVLKGNGSLWWTTCLNLGLNKILKIANKEDFIWIINNDCYFDRSVLQNLLTYEERIGHGKYIVGSVIIDSKTKKIFDDGVGIDWERMKFKSGGTDALSTKGTLYPINVFKQIGIFDAKHFPHYFSDYEFSIRVKRNGYYLTVCRESKIFNRVKRTGIDKIPVKLSAMEAFKLLFSRKSKINLPLQINIIRYVCPKEFRIRNYWLLLTKLLDKLLG